MNRSDLVDQMVEDLSNDKIELWEFVNDSLDQDNRVAILERKNAELEYASRYNARLNELIQKRNLPPKTLGRHIVKVAMDYIEELERDRDSFENKYAEQLDESQRTYDYYKDKIRRYREAIQHAFFTTTHPDEEYAIQKVHEILDDAMKIENRE